MRKTTALTLVALTAGIVAGCSADTNTLDVDRTSRTLRMRNVETEEVIAGNRSFYVLDNDKGYVALQNGRPLTNGLYTGGLLVPHDNSRRIRTKDTFTVEDNGETYILANAFPQNGVMILNQSGAPKTAFYVTSTRALPVNTEVDANAGYKKQSHSSFSYQAEGVELVGDDLISLPAKNPFGGPDRVYIRKDSAKFEVHETSENGATRAEQGIRGVGFYPVLAEKTSSGSEGSGVINVRE